MNLVGGGNIPPPTSYFYYIFLTYMSVNTIYTKRGRIHHEEKTK